jgi:FAD binding domain-containing protein
MITRRPFHDYLQQTHQAALLNVHGTVVFRPEAIIGIESGPDDPGRYARTVDDVCSVLGEALAAGKRLRCLGRRWSVSPVATTEGWLLDLSDTTTARWLAAADLVPELGGRRDVGHLLVAAGASIRWLNRSLHRAGWSLQTSGASNGQAVAGAIATGTHGSSVRIGALHDTVAAIHVVVAPTEHWLVEPESAPLASSAFATDLGAKLVRSDEMFHALQTSLGSLGVVVGVVFRCVRNFWLRLKRYSLADGKLPAGPLSLPQLIDRLAGWQFDTLVGQPAERIWHVDAVFNPFMPEKQCYVSAYITDTPPPGEAEPNVTGEYRGDEWSPDVLQFVARLAGTLAGGPGVATQIGLNTEYAKPVPDAPRVWGAWFTGQDLPGGALALSLGVDCDRLVLALNTVLATVRAEGRVPCVVATRFVPRSSALLAMNQFGRTCMIDIDGPNLPAMGDLLRACCGALESAGVPFTMHWGKWIGYLTRSYVEKAYGDHLEQWRKARGQLLSGPQLATTFSNEVFDNLIL